MRKLRLREDKISSQGHTAPKWQRVLIPKRDLVKSYLLSKYTVYHMTLKIFIVDNQLAGK